MTLADIEAFARRHAAARAVLVERMQGLEDELAAVRRSHARGLKGALQTAAATESELRAAVDGARPLFERPRTRVLHGLKVGLRKQPGKLTWTDPAHVVKLIRRHRPDEADALIRVTEAPVREALKQLPARELKRLGVEIAEASDAVEVRATDTAVDKWVDAMLAGLRDELEQAEAGP